MEKNEIKRKLGEEEEEGEKWGARVKYSPRFEERTDRQTDRQTVTASVFTSARKHNLMTFAQSHLSLLLRLTYTQKENE